MNLYAANKLFLLLIIPLLGWIILRSSKSYERRFKQFADPEFMPIYLARRSPFYSGLKLFLLLIASCLLIVGLSRPQWDYREQEFDSVGMDIIFAIDVSQSMDAKDIQPNRLTRSILQVSAFIDQLQQDRLGIVSFAGAATVECPLTDDHEAVKMVLRSLSTESAARPGTDIGRALDLASSAFNAGSGSGILILISDGEDILGNAISKAKDLADSGVRIYTMGVGSDEGAIITNPHTGAEHISRINSETLERMAKVSGGEFYRITPSAAEIQLVLSRIYRSEHEHGKTRKTFMYKEQYHIFVIAALLLLLFESMVLPYKKKRNGLKQ